MENKISTLWCTTGSLKTYESLDEAAAAFVSEQVQRKMPMRQIIEHLKRSFLEHEERRGLVASDT